jgi:hypothetical protein
MASANLVRGGECVSTSGATTFGASLIRRGMFGRVVGLAAAFAALMVATADAQPEPLSNHGIALSKGCESPKCVGDLLDCDMTVDYNDLCTDSIMIHEAWDVIDPDGSAIRVPAEGNLVIIEVSGNTTAVVGGPLPVVIGAPGCENSGLPGLDQPGSVTFGYDLDDPAFTYVIQPDDPRPLLVEGHIIWEDLCDHCLLPDPCPDCPEGILFDADVGAVTLINPSPSCEISGPDLVCPGQSDIAYMVEETSEPPLEDVTFEWTITGDGLFCDGSSEATGETVCVNADLVCGGSYTLTVIVTSSDGCVGECTFTATVNDELAPEITCPDPIEVQCPEDVPEPDTAAVTVSDNCETWASVTVEFIGDESDGNTCPETITRTYRATDFCGNFEECTQIITVNDTTPPELNDVPEGGDLGCNPTPPGCDPNVTATDNCDGDVEVTCTAGEVMGGPCDFSQTFTYSASDTCGNPVSQDVTYTWREDMTPPVLNDVPEGGDLGCNPTPPGCDPNVTATDECDGDVEVTCTAGEVMGGPCDFSQTFTYSASDTCGNPVSQDVTYTWREDMTPPVLNDVPEGGDLGCNPTPPGCDPNVTATDECDGDVEVTCTAGEVMGGPCDFSQTFTYSASDTCGNPVSQDVTYMWREDTTAPVLEGCPEDASYECLSEVPEPATVTAMDDCDGELEVEYAEEQSNPGSNCENTITRTWTATDSCDNVGTCMQTITVNDTTPPEIISGPEDMELVCEEVTPFTVEASDNCGGDVTLTYEVSADNPECVVVEDLGGGNYTITASCTVSGTVTFLATDECGNATDPANAFVFAFTAVCEGGEGCTPGYWKQPHHFADWTEPYYPDMLFSEVFEDAFPGMTLLEVLSQGGGGLNALGRHTVAALLNAASPNVSYNLTVTEVIDMFNDVYPGTKQEYNELKDYFEYFNELGCPLGGPEGVFTVTDGGARDGSDNQDPQGLGGDDGDGDAESEVQSDRGNAVVSGDRATRDDEAGITPFNAPSCGAVGAAVPLASMLGMIGLRLRRVR